MEVKYIFYHSKELFLKVDGKGEPLLLLHGYQADSRVWDYMIKPLTQKYKVIIPDLPGHGNTSLFQSINTMEHHAEVVNYICLSLGIDYFSVAGHSMGGYIALALAKKLPQYIEKLYLINSHPFEDSMAQVLARNRETELLKQGKKHLLIIRNAKNNFYCREKERLDELSQFATKLALEQPVNGMIADLAGMMARPNLSPVLQNSKFPISVIYGESDSKFPLDRINSLVNNKAELHGIEKCGHLSIIEKPETVANYLLD